MEKRIVISLLTIAAFLLSNNGYKLLLLMDWYTQLDSEIRNVIYKSIWYVAFPLLVLCIFHGFKKMTSEAGLASRAKEGILAGFIGTLPMLLGAGLLVGFKLQFDLGAILVGCLLAAVGEELLYRAMLFGQLFRHARWGFVWAGMASAIIFATGHLYQGNQPAELVGILLVTFFGGMWFSWLYVEWGYNLWVPMSFHFFMNLSWELFDVSDNALGTWAPNVFRAATIGLSVVLTLRHRRKMGEKLEVRGRRWWSGEAATAQPVKTVQAQYFSSKIGMLLLLFALPIAMSAQNERLLSGKVVDEHTHELAYVNIGIVGTSIGTVSGLDGSFQLYLPATVGEGDSIRFSTVGHEGRTWQLGHYRSAMGDNADIQLPSAAYDLPMVEVRPSFAKQKTIGMDRPGTRMAVNFAISDKPNQNLGAEIGRKFNLPKGQVQLDSFRFYVSRNNFDTVRLRVNLYQLERGRPGRPLLKENIIVELKPRQRGWVGVDLRPFGLVAEGNVVMSVEWVYHAGRGTALSMPIAMPSGGVHFYKFGSQGHWKKFPGMSAAMELMVGY